MSLVRTNTYSLAYLLTNTQQFPIVDTFTDRRTDVKIFTIQAETTKIHLTLTEIRFISSWRRLDRCLIMTCLLLGSAEKGFPSKDSSLSELEFDKHVISSKLKNEERK